jgi:hypothetical protein
MLLEEMSQVSGEGNQMESVNVMLTDTDLAKHVSSSLTTGILSAPLCVLIHTDAFP